MKRSRATRLGRAGLLLPLLLATACASIPDLGAKPLPASAGDYASAESFAGQQSSWPADGWWKTYHDPQLDRLTAEGLAGSPDLAAAAARAVGTAVGVTIWENHIQATRSTLTDVMNGTEASMQALQARGFGVEQSRQMVSQLVDGQATAISTLQLFSLAAAIFVGAAAIIWLAPKPRHGVDPGAAH